jgi:ACS family sodium-dependent inorganic phosphate cotransporter
LDDFWRFIFYPSFFQSFFQNSFFPVIIETLGWDWAFYVSAIITFVFVAFWYFLVSDSPAKHKRIKSEEIEYIEKSLNNTISEEKKFLPVIKICTSIPFLALLLLHYGNLWGLYFLLTAAPKFMNEVIKFESN